MDDHRLAERRKRSWVHFLLLHQAPQDDTQDLSYANSPFEPRLSACSRATISSPQHLWGVPVSLCCGSLAGPFQMGYTCGEKNQLQVINSNLMSQASGLLSQAFSFQGVLERETVGMMILLAVLPEIPELCFRWFLVPGPRTCPCFGQKGMPLGCAGCFWVHSGTLWHLEYLWWSQATAWGVSERGLLLSQNDILSCAILFCLPPVVTSNGWVTLAELLHCLKWCLCASCFLGNSDTFSASAQSLVLDVFRRGCWFQRPRHF